MSSLHQCDELPTSRHLETNSIDLNGAAPAPHATHLASDRVECEFVNGLTAKSRIDFRRVDLRSQPADGRRVVGIESVHLEIAAGLGDFVHDTEAAGGRQRRDQSRASHDREKYKAQQELHCVFVWLVCAPLAREDDCGVTLKNKMVKKNKLFFFASKKKKNALKKTEKKKF